ncbi:MAG: PHP domain-containing protein [Nitrospinaceae bacterium]
MNRRDFLKRLAGYSMGLASMSLALPQSAKARLAAPVTGAVGRVYLNRRVRNGLKAMKQARPGWVFGETHCHSLFSDGHYEVPSILHRAAGVGLDFILLTEHFTAKAFPMERVLLSLKAVRNCVHTWELAGHPPVDVYPAFEVSTLQGHLILVFPKEYYKESGLDLLTRHCGLWERDMPSMEGAARLGRAMGGVSIVPHPNIQRSYPFGVSTAFVKAHLTGLVDAIEDVSTGHGYRADYSKELGMAAVGSSDDHFNFIAGTSVTGYDGAQGDLLTALRTRSTQALIVDQSLHSIIAAGRTLM